MTRKILLPLIFLSTFSFIGCDSKNTVITNSMYKESYEQIEIKKALKEFETKIGLENLSERSVPEMFTLEYESVKEFVAMRGSKLNKALLNKETIYQAIERAKYLSNLIYEYEISNGVISKAYVYMNGINASDKLGKFIDDTLAFELLNTVINFGDIDSIISLIQNNDDKIYEYNYLSSLLWDYFSSYENISTSDRYFILNFLGAISTLSFDYQTDSGITTFEILKDDVITKYNAIKNFLEKQ